MSKYFSEWCSYSYRIKHQCNARLKAKYVYDQGQQLHFFRIGIM